MSEQIGGEHGKEEADSRYNEPAPKSSGSGSPPYGPKPSQSGKNPDPPNWVEKWTLVAVGLTFLAAGAAAFEADRLARDTEQALADGRLATYTSHLDAVNAEKLTADAVGQAQLNANGSHADTMAAIARSDTANGISKRSTQLSERAWVYPAGAAITAAVTAGQPFKATIAYINGGKEPAINFISFALPRTFSKIDWFNGKAGGELTKWASDCLKSRYTKKNPPTIGAATVFPGTSQTPYTLDISSDSDDSRRKLLVSEGVVNGSDVFVVQACFIYRSIQQTHHSAFCGYYRAGETKFPTLSACTTGSGGD